MKSSIASRVRKTASPWRTLGSNYEHAFTESTKITNKLLVEAGADNTSVQNDLALAVNMTDTLALAVGIGVRYNIGSTPAGGIHRYTFHRESGLQHQVSKWLKFTSSCAAVALGAAVALAQTGSSRQRHGEHRAAQG